jgi:predicted RNase H-like HicB family nuclease
MRYKIYIQEDEEGYTVWAPECPGCWAQGVTEEQAMDNINDAIRKYIKSEERSSDIINTRYIDVD